MSVWGEIRRQARQRHAEVAPEPDLVPAAALLGRACEATRVRVLTLPAGDPLLACADAAYDHERRLVYLSAELPPDIAAYHAAHELAHHWLDGAETACSGAEVDDASPAEPDASPVGEVMAYGPKERSEARANVHGREWLVPGDKLRRHCARGRIDAEELARTLGVPESLVFQQLADALLLPEGSEAPAPPGPREEGRGAPRPDPSQRRAIEAPPGAHQVRAKPGTGKTLSLVGCVVSLLERGEDPASIVTLTYANAAAADLHARIVRAAGERGAAVWTSTFHAFGLELLRKHGGAIGLPEDVRLLTELEALLLLEELLPALGLEDHVDLRDPLVGLRTIQRAIGRAKDELVSAVEYERAARAIEDAGARARALEVARAYAAYDAALRAKGWVDFGDLIVRSVELLRRSPAARRAIRSRARHVLVDEYQDMNRASGVLLRELCEGGTGPWVVGDVNQSVHRWRGASPLNMASFGDDFPDAETTDLATNYRSRGRIVRLFEAFGATMASAAMAGQERLVADRGEEGGVLRFEVASTFEAEAAGLAERIRAHVERGGRFRDHAVLARSHGTLASLARMLEQDGIPCLYFGDFFERAEIRDLLALLSVVAEPEGLGIWRAGQLPRYAVPTRDLAALVAFRRSRRIPMRRALGQLAEVDGLTGEGRRGLERLAHDLAFSTFAMSPHGFLARVLFVVGGGDLLRPHLADGSVAGQQRRLAIHQLLRFARTFDAPAGGDPKRALLAHVRLLSRLDEDKAMRQLPAEAADIDAVRLMTVHASKGLEFPVVHLPALSAHHFPPPRRTDPCPMPPGLGPPVSGEGGALMSNEAEEESLFYVAITRAQEELHLSRARAYGGRRSVKPSPFLDRIAAHLPEPIERDAGSPAARAPAAGSRVATPDLGFSEPWTARGVETYVECPRRFYYEKVARLGGDEPPPVQRLHAALRSSLDELRRAPSAEERRTRARVRFEEDWQRTGARLGALAPVYRAAGLRMLDTAAREAEGEALGAEYALRMPRSGAEVACRADDVRATPSGVVVLRWKLGRLSKRERPRARHALLLAAVRAEHPGAEVRFEHVSLLTGERREAPFDERRVGATIDEADRAIARAGQGHFEPLPDERTCARCPYLLVCAR